jgi:hypothetical protein
MNSRSTVHEYGGGDFCPTTDLNLVLSLDHSSQNIKQLSSQGLSSVDITPPDQKVFRYADLSLDPLRRGFIYAIREDHTIDTPSKVVNCIVAIPSPRSSEDPWEPTAVSDQRVLVNEEQDPSTMYSTPLVDPSGRFLCWMEWSHPNMPWDEASIVVGLLSSDGGAILSRLRVAGEFPRHLRCIWSPSS